MQVYSDPERENDEHSLPDVEVFYHDGVPWGEDSWDAPGVWDDCETEEEAIAAAQGE